MKFDFAIGNPPYQEENKNNGRQSPIYNYFMDEAYKVATCVELIHPARFLFDAGQTPKSWNKERLEDKHFKVLQYEADASKIFPSTDIKGGVAITIRDSSREYGAINIFTPSKELNDILKKVLSIMDKNLCEIITGAVPYSFTKQMKIAHPETVTMIEKSYDLRTNVLDKLHNIVFFNEQSQGKVQIWGQLNKKRECLWINREFLNCPNNFNHYKVMLSKAIGTGKFGESLGNLMILPPKVGHTQSYITIGSYTSIDEAENTCKYLKTKFVRTMLDILKVTQDITPNKFKYVPFQNFTYQSDINWSKSIHEIDLQLYKKYGLSQEEIGFIENNVKEMK